MNFQQYFSNNAARAHLAHPLQLLYKTSLKTGEIPINLKLASITPICKCGSRNLPMHELSSCSPYITLNKKNGRNISKNFHQFLETHQKMNTKQHGFHSGRSCLSQLLDHHNKILEELEKSNNVDVIYLDFAKAFNKVDHCMLLNKLKKKIGINGKIGVWIHNFLSNNSVLPSIEQH